ncbi:hypothetical protein CASFOL_012101 [Castilleja foliolosa]|uniref:Uncharacterized protein n=1 Tax=Castilleja foliolosa TaxID=1961234 RepID=A0ABD3DTH5_9LAMI
MNAVAVTVSRSEPDASDHSSSFLGSLEDETGITEERRNRSFDNYSLDLVGVDSEDCEVVYRPRQRAAVDYSKLYDVENAQDDVSPCTPNEPTSESEKSDHPDRIMSSDRPKNLKTIASVRKTHLSQTAECNQMTTDPVDGMSLRHLKEKAKESKKKLNCKSIDVGVLEAETEMKRLCEIKSRVQKTI